MKGFAMRFNARLTRLQFVRLCIAGLCVLLSNSFAFAIMPRAQQANVEGGVKPSATKVAMALKNRMAEAKRRPDLTVSWDVDRGIPASIYGDDLLQELPAKGQGPGVASAPDFRQKAVQVMGAVAGFYGIRDATKEFAARSPSSSVTGYRHVRLDQAYKGLPVFGGEVIVHFDGKGKARSVNGMYRPIEGVATAPKLTPDEAVAVARADQKAMGKDSGRVTDGPRLVIYARDTEPTLAYQLTVSYATRIEVGRWRYWIDAQTGGILLRYNDVPTATAPGPGVAADITGNLLLEEGGTNVTINGFRDDTGKNYLYSYINAWYLYNTAISDYVYLYFNTWGSLDRTVISAGYNCEKIEAYYRDILGRSILLTNDVMLVANVHNTGMANAFWDGQSINLFDELPCALDVMAHEVTHGVDQYSANLIYADESGALNESMSDIFSALVEFYVQPDGTSAYPGSIPGHADWLMGEDTALAPAIGVLRDLSDPQKYGQPSKYKGTNWDPKGEVHQNDGVQNFFFYLLCNGGIGTNDGIAYSVNGLGTPRMGVPSRAATLAYLTLTQYMTKNTGYVAGRNAWVAAARETDGAGITTNAEVAVLQAWAAVGVGPSDFVSPATAFVSVGDLGVTPYLPSNMVYSVLNPTGTNLTWSIAVSSNVTWLDISASSVDVASGHVGTVTLVINQAVAAALDTGVYRTTVLFTNALELGNTSREVVLHVGNNYVIKPADYHWVDPVAASHTALSLSSDGLASTVLPFPVCYYGTPYTNLYVSTYGVMGFDPSGLATNTFWSIPSPGLPNNMICALRDPWLSGGQVYYGLSVLDSITNVVVTWLDMRHLWDTSARFSFQVRIPYEPLAAAGIANNIVMQYKDVAESSADVGSGQWATIGIEDATGSSWSRQYSYIGERWLANERALLFTQTPRPIRITRRETSG